MNLGTLTGALQGVGDAGGQFAQAKLDAQQAKLKALMDSLRAQSETLSIDEATERLKRLKASPSSEQEKLDQQFASYEKVLGRKLTDDEKRTVLRLRGEDTAQPKISSEFEAWREAFKSRMGRYPSDTEIEDYHKREQRPAAGGKPTREPTYDPSGHLRNAFIDPNSGEVVAWGPIVPEREAFHYITDEQGQVHAVKMPTMRAVVPGEIRMTDKAKAQWEQIAPEYGSKPPSVAGNFRYAMKGPYQTQLQPQEEVKFQQWVKENKIPWEDSPKSDYDMRGYWKSLMAGDPKARTALNSEDGKVHYPDTWKTPFHKTFSNESKYALPSAPHWEGNKLVSTAPTGSKNDIIGTTTPKYAPPLAQALKGAQGAYKNWIGAMQNSQYHTPKTDLAIVFAAVRAQVEGAGRMTNTELDRETKAGSFGDRFQRWYDSANNGTLPDDQRQDLLNVIRNSWMSSAETARSAWESDMAGKPMPSYIKADDLDDLAGKVKP